MWLYYKVILAALALGMWLLMNRRSIWDRNSFVAFLGAGIVAGYTTAIYIEYAFRYHFVDVYLSSYDFILAILKYSWIVAGLLIFLSFKAKKHLSDISDLGAFVFISVFGAPAITGSLLHDVNIYNDRSAPIEAYADIESGEANYELGTKGVGGGTRYTLVVRLSKVDQLQLKPRAILNVSGDVYKELLQKKSQKIKILIGQGALNLHYYKAIIPL